MLTVAESEKLAGTSVVGFAVARDVVAVDGEEAGSYLQGQLSQDVTSMAPGTSRWSLLLQPQGKLDTWLRVTRLPDDRWLLDTDPGAGADMVRRLERFKLRTKVGFEVVDWTMVALRGPGSDQVEPPTAAVAADPAWPAMPGVDFLGPGLAVPDPVPEGHPDALEVLRIRSGVPRMGYELDERTIAAEAGIVDRSASFTKGCYVGQELVARIDSRGNNTPRRLYGLRLADSAVPAPGAAVVAAGAPVGHITSAACSPGLGGIALAYLKRGTPVPGEVEVEIDGGVLPARAVELPMG